MGFLDGLGDLIFGHEETVEEKASKVDGWSVEKTETGYTVKGVDAWDDKPATWELNASDAKGLLDHVHSVQLGDAYLLQKYGSLDTTGDASRDCEIKHEVREYRLQALEDESKPLWKQILGL
jgi:hypothetical protein